MVAGRRRSDRGDSGLSCRDVRSRRSPNLDDPGRQSGNVDFLLEVRLRRFGRDFGISLSLAVILLPFSPSFLHLPSNPIQQDVDHRTRYISLPERGGSRSPGSHRALSHAQDERLQQS